MSAETKGFLPLTGFTLVELLIVVAIISILAVVVVITLNPSEIFKQARDSTRLSDLNTLNKALSIYETDTLGIGSLGQSSTTYVSIPDPNATTTQGTNCSGLGLPPLPSGWTYHCAASSTYRNIDGTGWIPVNFQSISSGSPIGKLPVDPVNTTSSGSYYTYVPGGSWKLAAIFESQKYAERAANDGGIDLAAYEIGTNLNLAPFVGGMFGYWKFDEIGISATDFSGFANHGTMYSSGTVADLHISSDCRIGSGCANLDGINDYIDIPNYEPGKENFTLLAWFNLSNTATTPWDYPIFGNEQCLRLAGYNPVTKEFAHLHQESSTSEALKWNISGASLNDSLWHHMAVVVNQSAREVELFIDGVSKGKKTIATYGYTSNGRLARIGRGYPGDTCAVNYWKGKLDEMVIYRNRVLTAAEIQAIYNATK